MWEQLEDLSPFRVIKFQVKFPKPPPSNPPKSPPVSTISPVSLASPLSVSAVLLLLPSSLTLKNRTKKYLEKTRYYIFILL